ncbi:hypothetical protein BDV25DRAFT_137561 [Aspergillus avenaceus]|uniref:Uncharacterized protein n=1 Tax=Aspergillus avenaceus TaxID=36643 RepID=A0A5N6U293_ASPAV|nr:hypothetical protein BDV25DRAFT_137561 [Aspergillus avenaceus]
MSRKGFTHLRIRGSLPDNLDTPRHSQDGESTPETKEEKLLERSSVVPPQNRWTSSRFFLQFHLIPVGVAIACIILNLKGTFLGSGYNQWVNLLQFVSKVHEILMHLSITTIAMGYLLYVLTSEKPVPFGALFSIYNTTQVGYLWSKEFIASITSQGFPVMMKITFVLMMIASILLAAVVGPASAIAMVPRYVNYTLPDRAAIVRAETPQPFASTFCLLNTIMGENDTRPIQFPDGHIYEDRSTVGTINYTGITRRHLWNQTNSENEGQVLWVDDFDPSKKGSLGAIVVQPDLCYNNKTYLSVSACSVAGLWANATQVYILKGSGASDQLRSLLSVDFVDNLPSWTDNAVSIPKSWAKNITSQTGRENKTVADVLLNSFFVTDLICPSNGSYPDDIEYDTGYTLYDLYRPWTHEGLISSLIVNAMSWGTGYAEATELSRKNEKFEAKYDDESWTSGVVSTTHGQLLGYAWNMDGTGIRIAIPVLLIYCICAIVYILYTLVSGRSLSAWETIAGLTALAFNSTPSSVLQSEQGTASRTDTFRNLVSIREVEEREQLEFVFQKDHGVERLRVA